MSTTSKQPQSVTGTCACATPIASCPPPRLASGDAGAGEARYGGAGKQSRKLTIPLLVLLAICLFGRPAEARYGGGTGEPNDPYLIYTAEQMNAIGLYEADWDKHFKLMADIDLAAYTGTDFNIIGYWVVNRDSPDNKPFTGVFDGNGHTISNFTCISTEANYVGLFGCVEGENAEIKNLGLIDPNVDAGTAIYVGSLVGWLRWGTITNCYVEGGSVSGNDDVGGLVGWNRGTITNSYSTASVSGNWCVGGLVGDNYDTITNCYARGSVSGNESVGGLAGSNGGYGFYTSIPGTISNCYSVGGVTGNEDVGGLVGLHEVGSVTSSFWDIQTSGQTISAGGTGKTTAQMQMASTFLGWGGCGNEGIWVIDEGSDYPRLWWENKPGELLDTKLSDFLTGAGTEDDPYLIYTAEELNMIGLFLCDWDKHFKLMADIDLSGYAGTDFNIIGTYWYNRFTGVFNGNGHTISNFSYTSTDIDHIGLFGYVSGENAVIKDLGLIDPNVDAGTGNCVGSLVANNGGIISGCYVEGGSVSGDWGVGGLVGYNGGTITNCYATANVTGGDNVGGLVGWNNEIITNCYSSSHVSGTRYRVGGLVGSNTGTISKCSASSSVSGDEDVAGLVGDNGGRINNSSATGSVLGTTSVGGLVGYNSKTINDCYATGTVTGTRNVGGLVGWRHAGTITNCYSSGGVSGDEEVGGLVGQNGYFYWPGMYPGTISNCYSTGSVSGDSHVGGLVGYSYIGELSNSFWDIQTSGQAGSAGGTGKTTAEMQMASTFLDADWDFVAETANGTEDIWWILEGRDYPRLWWELIEDDSSELAENWLAGVE